MIRTPCSFACSQRPMLTASAAAALLLCASVHAQQVPPPAAAASAATSPTQLDAVVVTATRAKTATKTDTALVETPQAISVITAEQIEDRGAIGLQEALRYAPGVRTEPNGSDYRFDYVTARGGFEAAEYQDGLRRPTTGYGARTEVYTLERVEVLRGPSSVLYGQGAAGGIVNTVTKKPQYTFGGEVGVEVGSFGRKQTQLDLTGPLNEAGTLAGRVVGVARDAGNQVDFGKDNRVLLAPSLRWTPDTDTDVVFNLLYQRDRAASIASFLPVNATLLAPPGRELPAGAYLGEPGLNVYDTDQSAVSLLVTHRFNESVSLSSGLRYNRSHAEVSDIEPDVWNGEVNPFLDPPDNRLLPRYRYDLRARMGTLTADNNLRFEFQTGAVRHKALVGIDYSRVKLESSSTDLAADPIDIYAPVYGNVVDSQLNPYTTEVDSQVGVYVQDQIRFGESTALVLGARRDRASTAVEGSPTQVDHATTWRAGLIVDVGANVSPYVSYSESFQPTIGLDANSNPFVPQRGVQYEVGVKWQPAPRTLVTLAAFDIKGTNRLATDPNDGNNQIQQGEVSSRGFEIEGSHELLRNFSVSASFSHVKARLSRSADPLEVGTPISAVAKNQASVWGEKTFVLDNGARMRAGLGVRYTGASTEAVVFDGAVESLTTPSFTLADAMVAMDWQKWSVALNATNLLDKWYYASCSVRSACGTGYRRNVVGTVSYRF